MSPDDDNLHEAASQGDALRVQHILAQHDFLHGRIGALDMAVAAAVRGGHFSVAHLLLDAREGSSAPLHPHMVLGIARNGDFAVANRVFDLLGDISGARLPNGRTALHGAAANGNDDVVAELLRRGADAESRTNFSRDTPLHYAASQGSTGAARLLLDAGADPNARNRDDMTPLALADMNGQSDMCELLLARGADPATRELHGRTPLHRAADLATAKEVRALLASGADPNARDHWKDTPLHLAARRDTPAIVRALMDAGADLNAQNSAGDTPLTHAASDQLGTHTQTVRLLLAQPQNLNLADVQGWSALHALVYMGDPDLLRLGIEAGADTELRDQRGETPFLKAATYHYAPCLQVLADAGADTAARDLQGRNAADLVVLETNAVTTDHDVAAAARVLAHVMRDDFKPAAPVGRQPPTAAAA
jgi:ankyrin repeat protein